MRKWTAPVIPIVNNSDAKNGSTNTYENQHISINKCTSKWDYLVSCPVIPFAGTLVDGNLLVFICIGATVRCIGSGNDRYDWV